MARTKASVGAKISSGKSSKARCSVAPTTSTGVSAGSSDKAARSSGGGNPVCPRETPKWQRPITTFFINKHNESRESDTDVACEDGEAAGSSKPKPKPKRNVIQSSDEEPSPEKPTNTVLDETIELETLTGENSHKIQEYYPNGVKGKGVGKKTKNKDLDINGDSDMTEEKNLCKLENGENISNSKDKENVDRNIDKSNAEDQIGKEKDSNIKERSKRERDDGEEEENANKKIKVN